MKRLDYPKLMELNPTVYVTVKNTLEQSFDLVEHPTQGDSYPVIILCHENKIAVCSDFWDTEDMQHNEDYMPVYHEGDIYLNFEVVD